MDYQSKINEWEAIKGNVASLIDTCMECGDLAGSTYNEISGLCVSYAPIDNGVIGRVDLTLEEIHSMLLDVFNICEKKINYYRQLLAELQKKNAKEKMLDAEE